MRKVPQASKSIYQPIVYAYRMSQSADSSPDTDKSTSDTDPSTPEEPDIEEDLFEEELRIDGICGVY
jgi:mycofactocin precursor